MSNKWQPRSEEPDNDKPAWGRVQIPPPAPRTSSATPTVTRIHEPEQESTPASEPEAAASADPVAAIPPPPPPRRRPWRIVAWLVAISVLLAAAAWLAWWLWNTAEQQRRTDAEAAAVTGLVTALSKGNATEALAHCQPIPDTTLINDDILAAAAKAGGGISLERVDGLTATVRMGDETTNLTFQGEHVGKKVLLTCASQARLDVGEPVVTIGDTPVDTAQPVWLMPGRYPVAPRSGVVTFGRDGEPWMRIDPDTTTITAAPRVSDDGQKQLTAALHQRFEQCMTNSRALVRLECGLKVTEPGLTGIDVTPPKLADFADIVWEWHPGSASVRYSLNLPARATHTDATTSTVTLKLSGLAVADLTTSPPTIKL